MALLKKKFRLFAFLLIAPIFIGAILLCGLIWRAQHSPLNVAFLLPITSHFHEEKIESDSLTLFWDRKNQKLLIVSESIFLKNRSYQVEMDRLSAEFDIEALKKQNFIPAKLSLNSALIGQLTKNDEEPDTAEDLGLEAKLEQVIAKAGDYLSKIPRDTNTAILINEIHVQGVLPAEISGQNVKGSLSNDAQDILLEISGDIGVNQDFVAFTLGLNRSDAGILLLNYNATGITPTTVEFLSKSAIDLSWLRLDARVDLNAKIDLVRKVVDELNFSAFFNNLILGQTHKSAGIRFSEIPITIHCKDSFKDISIEPFVAKSRSGDLALKQFEVLKEEAYSAVGSFAINNLGFDDFKEILQDTALPFHFLENADAPIKIKESTFDFDIRLSKPPEIKLDSIKIDSNFHFVSGEQEFEVELQSQLFPESDELHHIITLPWINPYEVAGFIPDTLKAYLPSAETSLQLSAIMSKSTTELKKLDLVFRSKEGTYNLPLKGLQKRLLVNSTHCHLVYDSKLQEIEFKEFKVVLPFCVAEIENAKVKLNLDDASQSQMPTEIVGRLSFENLDYASFSSEFKDVFVISDVKIQNMLEDLKVLSGKLDVMAEANVPLAKGADLKIRASNFEYSSLAEAKYFESLKLSGHGTFNTETGGAIVTNLELDDFSEKWVPIEVSDIEYHGSFKSSIETKLDRRVQPITTTLKLNAVDVTFTASPNDLIQKALEDRISVRGAMTYDWVGQGAEAVLSIRSDLIEALEIKAAAVSDDNRFNIDLSLSGNTGLESLTSAYAYFDLPQLEQKFSGRAQWGLHAEFVYEPGSPVNIMSLPINGNVKFNNLLVREIRSNDQVNSTESELVLSTVNGLTNITFSGDLSYTDPAFGLVGFDIESATLRKKNHELSGPADFSLNAELTQHQLQHQQLNSLIQKKVPTSIQIRGVIGNVSDLKNTHFSVSEFNVQNGSNFATGSAEYDRHARALRFNVPQGGFNGLKAKLDFDGSPSVMSAGIYFDQLDVDTLSKIMEEADFFNSSKSANVDSEEDISKDSESEVPKTFNLLCGINSLYRKKEPLASDLLFNLTIDSALNIKKVELAGTLSNQQRFSLRTDNEKDDKLNMNLDIGDLITTVEISSDIASSVTEKIPSYAAKIPFSGGRLKGVGNFSSSIKDLELSIDSIEIDDLYIREPPFFLRLFSQKAKDENSVQAGHSIQKIKMENIHLNKSGLSIHSIDVVGRFTLTISDLIYTRHNNFLIGVGIFSNKLGIEFEGPLDDIQFYLKEMKATKLLLPRISKEEELLF